jgi:hypothetical protein
MAYTAKNEDFIAAEQWVHQAIANKSKDTKSLWRSKIATGKFEYGRGYMMKKHAFYGGKEITSADGDWDQLKPPEDRGPTDDACSYNPPTVGYGFEEKKYTIYETTRRTETICLRDLTFKWKFVEQMKMIMDNLSDITLGVWEKFLRETYITFASKMIVAEGFPQFTVEGGLNASGVMVSAGLRTINLGGVNANTIGRLTQGVLDNQYQYLARQCPKAGLSTSKNGMPVFGLVTSFETSTEIISLDKVAREDRHYIREDFLLEGYGTISGYKNWAHIHDLETPRYKLSQDGAKLERVYPYEFTPTSIGDANNISKDYVTAHFELSVVFMNNVFKALIPENPTTVGRADFGGCSNLGEFKWVNIAHKETNLLRENGFMFARFNAAPEPQDNVDNAVVLLHTRPQAIPIVLPTSGVEDGVATALNVTAASAVIVASADNIGGQQEDLPTTYDEVEVVCDGTMNVTVGEEAHFIATGLAEDVRITRDYGTGRYRVRFDAAASNWVAKITAHACTLTAGAA